jgi:hypothetical protein
MDHKRLRFTMDRRHGRPWELTRARPPTTLGLNVAREGAGEVEEVVASTFVGSSELRVWGNGGAAKRDGRRRSVLGEVGCGLRSEQRRAGVSVVMAGGAPHPFIGAERRGVVGGGGETASDNGLNAIEGGAAY